jgi:hypothetical protein
VESEGSLPHSQEPATCPHPEPDRSSLDPPSNLSKMHFNIILPSTRMKIYRYIEFFLSVSDKCRIHVRLNTNVIGGLSSLQRSLVECADVDWIKVTHDSLQWRAHASTEKCVHVS